MRVRLEVRGLALRRRQTSISTNVPYLSASTLTQQFTVTSSRNVVGQRALRVESRPNHTWFYQGKNSMLALVQGLGGACSRDRFHISDLNDRIPTQLGQQITYLYTYDTMWCTSRARIVQANRHLLRSVRTHPRFISGLPSQPAPLARSSLSTPGFSLQIQCPPGAGAEAASPPEEDRKPLSSRQKWRQSLPMTARQFH